MHISDLANEILLHIFQSAPTISTLHALSATCKHFHTILSHHRLPTLYLAASNQYGPLTDAIRIATHNESQAAHIPRSAPPQSLALLKRLIEVGRVAEAWTSIYPRLKWRGENSMHRRSLSAEEKYRLRRACYRIWLYTLAFHTPTYHRQTRLQPLVIRTRALLLRPWPSSQLAEMLDLHACFRRVLHSHVCPSNGTVLRRHRRRWPDDPFPLLERGCVRKMEVTSAALTRDMFHCSLYGRGLEGGKGGGVAVEGWGDEISQYYVVEDMLKCHPGQLMIFLQAVMGQADVSEGAFGGGCVGGAKGVVEQFVAGLGEWFDNNGETMVETVGFVVGERGGDVGALREGVEEGWEGIARRDE